MTDNNMESASTQDDVLKWSDTDETEVMEKLSRLYVVFETLNKELNELKEARKKLKLNPEANNELLEIELEAKINLMEKRMIAQDRQHEMLNRCFTIIGQQKNAMDMKTHSNVKNKKTRKNKRTRSFVVKEEDVELNWPTHLNVRKKDVELNWLYVRLFERDLVIFQQIANELRDDYLARQCKFFSEMIDECRGRLKVLSKLMEK